MIKGKPKSPVFNWLALWSRKATLMQQSALQWLKSIGLLCLDLFFSPVIIIYCCITFYSAFVNGQQNFTLLLQVQEYPRLCIFER